MRAKTILAGLFAAAALPLAAEAADLPMRKATPVEYLRICDAFGEGFFYIPGSDTCLRFNGSLRAENTIRGGAPYDVQSAFSRNLAGTVYRRDYLAFRARGYLNADARTKTSYGDVRTYVSFRITADTTAPGPSGGGSFRPAGSAFNESTGAFQGLANPAQQSVLDKAFIQFAGLTAGRAQSFFDFDAQSYELLTNTFGNSNQLTEMLAYTASFGSGFSATVSVEDAGERRIGDSGFQGVNFAGATVNNAVPAVSGGVPRAGILAYGGESLPDFVGNLRYDAAWGAAQISGAYHQLRSQPETLPRALGGRTVAPTADAFAVSGGFKVLLPTIAKGDNFTIQGTYEEGAMDYINPINYQPVGFSNVFDNNLSVSVPVNDAFLLPNGTIGKNNAWAIYAAARHYWIPNVYSSLFGDYGEIRNPAAAQRIGASTDNATIYQVGFNTIYLPTKDFQIGAEVLYSNLNLHGLAALGATPHENDDIRARFSIRRAF